MDSQESEEAPVPKKRFFSDYADEPTIHHTRDDPSPSTKRRQVDDLKEDSVSQPLNGSSSPHTSSRSPLSEKPVNNGPNRHPVPPVVAESSKHTSTKPAFDRATFEAFVGGEVDNNVLEVIQDHCGDNLERAVNIYFDGTWKNLKRKPTVLQRARVSHAAADGPRRKSSMKFESDVPQRQSPGQLIPESRYIGAFGVAGWATRSGTKLLKSGDIIKIERQRKQMPVSLSKSKTKSGAVALPNGPASKRADVVVRFTDSSGSELGRLEKEAANWVSTLIDQKVCKFEGACVWAPEILRTNDTVYLQLRCSMLRSAFFDRAFQAPDVQGQSLFESRESSEERDLRLRQVALVRLFEEIGLSPTKTNAASAKHDRQKLLVAAEMAEKKESEAAKPAKRYVSAMTLTA